MMNELTKEEYTPNKETIAAIENALKDVIKTGTGVLFVGKEGVRYVCHQDRIEEVKDDNQ